MVAAVPTLTPPEAVTIPVVFTDCPSMVKVPSDADIRSEAPSTRMPSLTYT